MRRPAVLLLATVLALAGCGADTGSTGQPGPAAAPGPAPRTVELQRSGGIAGIRERITVDPDGGWRHTARTGTTSGTLSADQLDRLTRMAGDPALAAEATRPLGKDTCADGYNLALTVDDTTVRWPECGPDTADPPLAARIARLLLESTK